MTPPRYPNIFDNAKFDTDGADRERLIQALRVLSTGENLETAVNVDEVLRYFAVQVFVMNWDSYLGHTGHNYFLYEEDGVTLHPALGLQPGLRHLRPGHDRSHPGPRRADQLAGEHPRPGGGHAGAASVSQSDEKQTTILPGTTPISANCSRSISRAAGMRQSSGRHRP